MKLFYIQKERVLFLYPSIDNLKRLSIIVLIYRLFDDVWAIYSWFTEVIIFYSELFVCNSFYVFVVIDVIEDRRRRTWRAFLSRSFHFDAILVEKQT